MEASQPREALTQRAERRLQEDAADRQLADDALDPLLLMTASGPAWRAVWALVQARD
jgi:hypothetical protein